MQMTILPLIYPPLNRKNPLSKKAKQAHLTRYCLFYPGKAFDGFAAGFCVCPAWVLTLGGKPLCFAVSYDLLYKVTADAPSAVLLAHGSDRFDGCGFVLELSLELDDDILAIRGTG